MINKSQILLTTDLNSTNAFEKKRNAFYEELREKVVSWNENERTEELPVASVIQIQHNFEGYEREWVQRYLNDPYSDNDKGADGRERQANVILDALRERLESLLTDIVY